MHLTIEKTYSFCSGKKVEPRLLSVHAESERREEASTGGFRAQRRSCEYVKESTPRKASSIENRASAQDIALIPAQVFRDMIFSVPRTTKSSIPLRFFLSLVFS